MLLKGIFFGGDSGRWNYVTEDISSHQTVIELE